MVVLPGFCGFCSMSAASDELVELNASETSDELVEFSAPVDVEALADPSLVQAKAEYCKCCDIWYRGDRESWEEHKKTQSHKNAKKSNRKESLARLRLQRKERLEEMRNEILQEIKEHPNLGGYNWIPLRSTLEITNGIRFKKRFSFLLTLDMDQDTLIQEILDFLDSPTC